MMMESLMMVGLQSFLARICHWKAKVKGFFCWKKHFPVIFLPMWMFCSNCESGERIVLCVATNCETAGIHAAIRGPTGHLFEHNSQIIGQIQANVTACKVNIAHKQLQLSYTSQLLEQMKKKFIPTC
jgi:hypothetical protein